MTSTRALVLALPLLTGAVLPSAAQQWNPRTEVYGLTGDLQPRCRKTLVYPSSRGGVLFPVGRKWAAVVDFGIGVAPVHMEFRWTKRP